MTTDLGLDWLSSTDLLGLGLCLFLSVFAIYIKNFPFLVLSAFAWMAWGLQISLATGSPMILMLIFSISAAEVIWGLKYKGW